jgi:hypothetical protein
MHLYTHARVHSAYALNFLMETHTAQLSAYLEQYMSYCTVISLQYLYRTRQSPELMTTATVSRREARSMTAHRREVK